MKRHLPDILMLACLALAFFVYLPGTSGYFLFDDTINIVDNELIRIQALDLPTLQRAAFSGSAGALGRPLAMLSFALDYHFHGLSPYHFKLTNILIHLVNGVCAYVLTLLILDTLCRPQLPAFGPDTARWIGLAVAAAWLLHPLNLTGVLYIVQRMTSLSALFTFLGLISYLHGRSRLPTASGWTWILASFLVFTPLAVFSKENGVLLPAFLLAAECILYRFQAPTLAVRRTLLALFAASVVLPGAAIVAYLLANPDWLTSGYAIRDFTLTERLLTEPRVLWFYLQNIVGPSPRQLGIFHDDIAISTSLLEPVTTLFACVGILLLLLLVPLLAKRQPIAAFGIAFFLIGHSLESTALALELAHEHRNYLPIYGVLLPLFYYLLLPLRHRQSLRARQAAALCFIVLLATITFMRAREWGDSLMLKQMAAENHPDSARSNMDIAAFYAALPATTQAEAEEFYRRAYEKYAKAASLSPSDTLGLFGLIDLNARHRLPIEPSWTTALAGRLERHPFAPNSGNSLASLAKCQIAGVCVLGPEIVETLVRAALRNPSLQGDARTQVLFAYSDFLLRIKGDRDGAAQAAYQAIAAYPGGLDFRLTLVQLLINCGLPAAAETELTKARALDVGGLHSGRIGRLQAVLDAKEDR